MLQAPYRFGRLERTVEGIREAGLNRLSFESLKKPSHSAQICGDSLPEPQRNRLSGAKHNGVSLNVLEGFLTELTSTESAGLLPDGL